MKEVKLILACDKNGLIGKSGKIPWHFPEDFKHFKETTEGHVVMMGRKTWDSLPRKPLVNRLNYILSRNMRLDHFAYEVYDVEMFDSVEYAYSQWMINESKIRDLFVIGGSQIYNICLDKLPVTEIIMTLVKGSYVGDTYFDIERLKDEVWNIDTIKDTPDFEIQRWRLAGLP